MTTPAALPSGADMEFFARYCETADREQLANCCMRLRLQLNDSERTVAELRAQVDAMEVAGQAFMQATSDMRERAEAAEAELARRQRIEDIFWESKK